MILRWKIEVDDIDDVCRVYWQNDMNRSSMKQWRLYIILRYEIDRACVSVQALARVCLPEPDEWFDRGAIWHPIINPTSVAIGLRGEIIEWVCHTCHEIMISNRIRSSDIKSNQELNQNSEDEVSKCWTVYRRVTTFVWQYSMSKSSYDWGIINGYVTTWYWDTIEEVLRRCTVWTLLWKESPMHLFLR